MFSISTPQTEGVVIHLSLSRFSEISLRDVTVFMRTATWYRIPWNTISIEIRLMCLVCLSAFHISISVCPIYRQRGNDECAKYSHSDQIDMLALLSASISKIHEEKCETLRSLSSALGFSSDKVTSACILCQKRSRSIICTVPGRIFQCILYNATTHCNINALRPPCVLAHTLYVYDGTHRNASAVGLNNRWECFTRAPLWDPGSLCLSARSPNSALISY